MNIEQVQLDLFGPKNRKSESGAYLGLKKFQSRTYVGTHEAGQLNIKSCVRLTDVSLSKPNIFCVVLKLSEQTLELKRSTHVFSQITIFKEKGKTFMH